MSVFADRLVSYSDALVAVSFVSVSGLGIAAAEPDIRCSLALAATSIMLSNVIFATLASVFVVKLRKWESELREQSDLSERARAIAQKLHWSRLVIIWVSALLSMLVLYASSQDARCAPGVL